MEVVLLLSHAAVEKTREGSKDPVLLLKKHARDRQFDTIPQVIRT